MKPTTGKSLALIMISGSFLMLNAQEPASVEDVSPLEVAPEPVEPATPAVNDFSPEPGNSLETVVVAASSPPSPAPPPDPVAAGPSPEASVSVEEDTTVIESARTVDSSRFDLPYTVNVVTLSTLEQRQVRNLTEALEFIPGVMVQKTANGQGSPYIRGFTGYRTLAVVDGVRYNNSVYRDGPSEYFSLIDSNAISSIELLQGPGSVLYGSDAIGGTLYLNTKSSNYLNEPEGETFFHGSSTYRYHSAEQSHRERLEFQTGVGGKWGFHIGGTAKHFGDVIAAKIGEEAYTGYDEWAYDTRFDYSFSDEWTFTAVHQKLSQDDVWRTHSTMYGVSFAGSDVGTDLLRLKDQHRSLSYLKLRGEDLDGFIDAATLTGSFQQWEENGERFRGNGQSLEESFNSKMWGVDLQLESDSSVGRFTYGLDYYVDHVDTARTDYSAAGVPTARIQGPFGDDSQFGQFGVYLQDQIEINERTELLIGGRYSYVKADIGRFEDPQTNLEDSFSNSWESVVGSARIIYDLDTEGEYKAFGGVSQSFRAPNLADLSRYGGSRSDEIESAATGLEPENFITYEVGFKAQTENVSTSLSYYYTGIKDMISSTPTGRVIGGLREVTKENSSTGFVQGIEASATYRFDYGFEVFTNFAWVEGEADLFPVSGSTAPVREPLSRIQPIIGSGGLRWTSPDETFRIEASVLAAAKANKLNRNDAGDTQRIPPGGTPGYAVFDIHADWNFRENITWYGGLENILDEAYRVHGSGSNEPGFGVVLGAKVDFK
ncbi:MAG: TonB-dependent receptor [Verrucomicrobiales bacterium]|nr:TonB-dependent receptor [Verrucomicrobiales bacterium]